MKFRGGEFSTGTTGNFQPELTHVIALNESGLHRVLKSYFEYYERTRTHLSLGKDAPIPRSIQPPELGTVIELPEVGGLHHRYERRAA